MAHALPQRIEALLDRLDASQPPGDTDPVRAAIGLVEAKFGARVPVLLESGLEVAEIATDLRLDRPAIAAALVHDLVARHELDVHALASEVGSAVATLAEGVLRLEEVHWDRLEEEAAESLRKMFLALASDVRGVLIALAARVHTMRHVDDLPDDERLRLSSETMEVFAPLANRLGIWQLKWELEDLAFRQLEPETYRQIKRLLAEKRAQRTKAIDGVIALLERELAAVGIDASVKGRPKHIYSIYKKMQRKGVDFAQIYDMSAVRIIVAEVADCYAALGLVHGLWTPIAGEFDDYIAKPKGNFYRSLHTAVVGPDDKPLEVQIRTLEMHEYNEFGVAAHWRYKEAKKADRRFDEKINWLRQLMQWQKEVTDPRDLAESLKTDIFQDQVYVFTPTGDVIDLPRGSTPVDFAYRIHTEVGHRCRGAKVRGQIVPLDYQLKTGDRVEIITAKTGGPSRDWLAPSMVQTSGAKQKIRQFFRQQERDQAILQGREVIEREFKRLGIEGRKPEEVMELYPKFSDPSEFLAALGFGDISSQSVAARLLELERPVPDALPVAKAPSTPAKRTAAAVSLAGVDDVMSQPARCCNPVPGDDVVGFITRGRGVMIHRVDCPNVRNPTEPERWMPLSWGKKHGHTYPVRIRIVGHDRPGLLRDIADLMVTENINMVDTSARSDEKEQTATIDATLRISSSEQLLRVLHRLERMPAVLHARRVTR